MSRRKICIVTGSRAEYGLLYWLMREISSDDDLQLQLVVTGMHLAPNFGSTYRAIEADGFAIDAKVEMLLATDTPVGITKSLGLGIIGFADVMDRLHPDIIVLLGDRYEIFAAGQAAMLANIPIAHIHGGEITEGATDDVIRHSLTKMAQLHFVSNKMYARRVVQLGEHPSRVFCVGPMAGDNINKLKLLSLAELAKSIKFSLQESFFLVTYHPVTLEPDKAGKAIQALFRALDDFPKYQIIITAPNADVGGSIIKQAIDKYAKSNPQRIFNIDSLGQLRYLSAMKLCSAVIGNSSSGVIEAPLLGVPTVNIGTRQTGRVHYATIIDCQDAEQDIREGITKALAYKSENTTLKTNVSNKEMAATKVKNIIKEYSLEGIINKRFYDLY